MLLSILIPTRNRPAQLASLIAILSHYIRITNCENKIEILISNNSTQKNSKLYPKFITVIEPENLFNSAEENLFSLLRMANGKYIWPLGDDDIPILDGFKSLIENCEKESYEAMIWNSRIIGIDGESLGHSRINLNHKDLEIDFEKFLERIGYWSIPAGISLTVYRNDINNFEFLKELMLLKTPIYSHVSYYAFIFSKRKFAFINRDLVHYQTNKHDVLPKKSNHWMEYSTNHGIFYRFPWTLGFVRQLKLLEEKEIINPDFFDNVLDISHFGRRFKIAEKVIELVFEQRMMELTGMVKIRIKEDELRELLDFLETRVPRYFRSYELLRATSDTHKELSDKKKIDILNSHMKSMEASLRRLPFHGYYRFMKSNYLYYETPLGWVAIKPILDKVKLEYVEENSNLEILRDNLNNSLTWALNGLEIPRFFKYHASSLNELEAILSSEQIEQRMDEHLENLFFLAPEKYAAANYNPPSPAVKMWKILPIPLRRLLKRILFT
jgi:hypothetical protein